MTQAAATFVQDVDQQTTIDDVDDEDVASEPEQTHIEEPRLNVDPVEEFIKPLVLEESRLYNLARRFSEVYRHLALTSDQQFLPTPVTQLPTGEEVGRYLAIDVGGSNLRVAFIELLGEDADSDKSPGNASERSRDTIRKAQRQRVRRTLEKAWPIQEHLKKDKAEDLFSWIGDCVAEVIADSLSSDATKGDIPEELEMGITFSFPIMQESVDEATLMPMGKGFAITSDLNLRNMLLSGYEKHTRRNEDDEPSSKRRKLYALPKLKIAAITNDTVATLVSSAYCVKSLPNSRVTMAIIVGTGCNATIPMLLSDLHESKAKLVSSRDSKATQTVVNTEITISGAAAPLKELNIETKWDIELDRACSRPGFQPFEYMTGGRYIGELVRIVFFDYLTNVVGVLKKELPANLVQEYALSTTYLSHKVARSRSDQELAAELARSLPPPESSEWTWNKDTAGAFRKIARAVQTRSAGLIAAAVVGLLACTREIQLRDDSARNSPQPPPSEDKTPSQNTTSTKQEQTPAAITSAVAAAAKSVSSTGTSNQRGLIVPLVVAYTGGIIQNYPNFKETCQRYIDRMIMRTGPQKSGKSVFLREASDGGVIGAGVLAGMVAGRS
ncbi:hypothetical protein TCE0_015f02697 [Talaromyces pinophilus]|uniref:Phosphotransferase n=1 Tax=Talaromyces pinophilus TaxID=128442 RepID=A0A6V8H411_TALPI|nr:hypothetical protein TCE0_015f02697 [Talaromyces pinophilus]